MNRTCNSSDLQLLTRLYCSLAFFQLQQNQLIMHSITQLPFLLLLNRQDFLFCEQLSFFYTTCCYKKQHFFNREIHVCVTLLFKLDDPNVVFSLCRFIIKAIRRSYLNTGLRFVLYTLYIFIRDSYLNPKLIKKLAQTFAKVLIAAEWG